MEESPRVRRTAARFFMSSRSELDPQPVFGRGLTSGVVCNLQAPSQRQPAGGSSNRPASTPPIAPKPPASNWNGRRDGGKPPSEKNRCAVLHEFAERTRPTGRTRPRTNERRCSQSTGAQSTSTGRRIFQPPREHPADRAEAAGIQLGRAPCAGSSASELQKQSLRDSSSPAPE